jgi:group I intron endonuclease
MFTYIATNTLNGKFYIGSSINFEKRQAAHLGSNDPYPFQRALRKNPEAFIWEVYEDNWDQPVLEQALLDQWFGKEQCYNLNPNAVLPPNLTGHKFSEETLKRRKESRTGKNYCGIGPDHHRYGVSHTEEAKQANREKHLGSFWVNNGASEKLLPKGSNVPEGFCFGRLFTVSEYPWWVHESGRTTRSLESPGLDWRPGRKWPVEKPIPERGYWWVNSLGETCRSKEAPGENWKRGRKW